MSKPFDLDELISRIKNLLQANGQPNPRTAPRRIREVVSYIEFGSVTVNFETHEVFVGGELVRMTPKELKLLNYFVENEGRVISRNELLINVWDLSGNLQTRAVDQFIARLRKIIEPDTTAPVHLLTIRDAGYRFVLQPQQPGGEQPGGEVQAGEGKNELTSESDASESG